MAECLFCAIVAGEIPATKVLETARILAFRDINPQAPTHVLVIPKTHYPDVAALAAADVILRGIVKKINALEPQMQALSDAELYAFATGRLLAEGWPDGRSSGTEPALQPVVEHRERRNRRSVRSRAS